MQIYEVVISNRIGLDEIVLTTRFIKKAERKVARLRSKGFSGRIVRYGAKLFKSSTGSTLREFTGAQEKTSSQQGALKCR